MFVISKEGRTNSRVESIAFNVLRLREMGEMNSLTASLYHMAICCEICGKICKDDKDNSKLNGSSEEHRELLVSE